MRDSARRWAALAAALLALGALAWWSYRANGLVFALVQATGDGDRSIEILREYLTRWGALGPAAYVLMVVIEVLVAPLPGTLLYAPGGVLFGGFLGGTLSLAGNVIGAGLAALIARFWGQPLMRTLDSGRLSTIRAALAERGLLLIFLLRVNPLTSSDLVSYAAGLVRVPIWKVLAGTFLGMAPLCYVQAYLADRVFRVVPGAAWVVVAMGLAYAAAVIWLIVRRPTGQSR